MHDPRMLLDPATGAVRRLARRGHHLDLARLGKLFSSQVSAVGAVDEARAEDVTSQREHARLVKARIQELAETRRQLTAELEAFLLEVPNLPAYDLPDGDSDEDAELVGTRGTKPCSSSCRLTTWPSGERLGILDGTVSR